MSVFDIVKKTLGRGKEVLEKGVEVAKAKPKPTPAVSAAFAAGKPAEPKKETGVLGVLTAAKRVTEKAVTPDFEKAVKEREQVTRGRREVVSKGLELARQPLDYLANYGTDDNVYRRNTYQNIPAAISSVMGLGQKFFHTPDKKERIENVELAIQEKPEELKWQYEELLDTWDFDKADLNMANVEKELARSKWITVPEFGEGLEYKPEQRIRVNPEVERQSRELLKNFSQLSEYQKHRIKNVLDPKAEISALTEEQIQEQMLRELYEEQQAKEFASSTPGRIVDFAIGAGEAVGVWDRGNLLREDWGLKPKSMLTWERDKYNITDPEKLNTPEAIGAHIEMFGWNLGKMFASTGMQINDYLSYKEKQIIAAKNPDWTQEQIDEHYEETDAGKSYEDWNKTFDTTEQLISKKQQTLAKAAERDPNTLEGKFFNEVLFPGVDGLTSLASMFGTAWLTKNPTLAASFWSYVESSPTYIEARRAGQDPLEAWSATAVQTGGTAALEKFGMDYFFTTPAGRNLARKFATNAITEGTTEVGQETFQNIIAKLSYDENRDVFEGAWQAFIGAVIASGGAVSMQHVTGMETPPELIKARETLVGKMVEMGASKAEAEHMANTLTSLGQKQRELFDQENPFRESKPAFLQSGITPEQGRPGIERAAPLPEVAAPLEIEPSVGVTPPVEEIKLRKPEIEEAERIEKAVGTFEDLQAKISGFSTKVVSNFRKIQKSIEKSQELQEGDIETIRQSEIGQDLNNALESVQEEFPHFSEDQAFDFIMDVPTAQELKVAKKETVSPLVKKRKVTLTKERLKAMETGIRKGAIKTRLEVKGVQENLISILNESNLTAKDKAKFTALIKNVQTARQLEGRLDEIMERVTRLEKAEVKRTVTRKIEKELKTIGKKKVGKVPKGQFGADVQAALNTIKQASKMTEAESLLQASTNIEPYLQKAGTEGLAPIIPFDVVAKNELLTAFSGIKDRTNAELEKMLADIQDLKVKGRDAQLLKKINKEAVFEADKQDMLQDITGGKELEKGRIEKKLGTSVKQFFKTMDKDFMGWYDVMGLLVGKDVKQKGFKRLAGKSNLEQISDVHDQVVGEHRLNRISNEQMRADFSDIYELKKPNGKVNESMVKNKMHEDSQTRLVGYDVDGVPLRMSQAELRKLWMEWQDPSLREDLIINNGYTHEFMDQLDTELLSTQDKQYAKAQLKFYKKLYGQVNKVFRELNGVDLPFNEFYSPIKREGVETDLSMGFEELMKAQATKGSIEKGSLKTRGVTNKKIAMRSDVQALMSHSSEMNHYIAWAEKVGQLNKLYTDVDIRNSIERLYGKGVLGVIDGFIKDFTTGGVKTGESLDWLDKMRGRMVKSVLAIKPALMIKQLTSFPALAENIPTHEFIKDFLGFFANPTKHYKILNQSEWLQARGKNLDIDIKAAQQTDEYAAFMKFQSFTNSLMLFTKLGDKGAIVAGGWAVYNYTKKQAMKQPNMTEEKAHKIALEEFERTAMSSQQEASLPYQSRIQRMGSFARLFTMFQSSQNLYFRKEMNAIRNLIKKRVTPLQFGKTIAIYHFILPMLFQYVANGFRWDEKDEKRAAILGSFNGAFILGGMLDYLIRGALGMDQFDMEVPIYGAVDDLNKPMKLLGKLARGDELEFEDWMKALDGLGDATGELTGLPIGSTVNIATGLEDIVNGEYITGLGEILGWSPYVMEQRAKATTTDEEDIFEGLFEDDAFEDLDAFEEFDDLDDIFADIEF